MYEILILFSRFPEEVILAEERTTDEEKAHIMEGIYNVLHREGISGCACLLVSPPTALAHVRSFSARRRAAAKRKKLKNLGKSKSTDTDEEENEAEDDDGESPLRALLLTDTSHTSIAPSLEYLIFALLTFVAHL